jgi:hypothetical protein
VGRDESTSGHGREGGTYVESVSDDPSRGDGAQGPQIISVVDLIPRDNTVSTLI